VEAQAALVGPQGAVELDPEGAVDVDLAAVVLPWHLEDDLPLELAQPLHDPRVGVFGVPGEHRADTGQDLVDSLVEFRLPWVAAQHLLIDPLELLGLLDYLGHGSSDLPLLS
jgi:hypothetical protein